MLEISHAYWIELNRLPIIWDLKREKFLALNKEICVGRASVIILKVFLTIHRRLQKFFSNKMILWIFVLEHNPMGKDMK